LAPDGDKGAYAAFWTSSARRDQLIRTADRIKFFQAKMEDGVEPGDDGELRIEDGETASPSALSSILDLPSSFTKASSPPKSFVLFAVKILCAFCAFWRPNFFSCGF
jgi:hypothetical protein